MEYDEYKKQYDRHTELIKQFDGLIATNEKQQHENSSELASAESRQAALTADKEPENVDTGALKAADADVQGLRDSRTELLEEWSELKAGRSEVYNSREDLTEENPGLESQRFSDSIPPPEGERGVGNVGKGAAVLLSLNVAAAETAELNAENREAIETISAQEHGHEPQEESDHKRPHLGKHIHEEHEYEEHRAQTTELVMSDPPEDGPATPRAEFTPPSSGTVAVSVSDGEPSQMATPRPPQPDDAVTTQTYQVNGQGATFGTGGIAPPNEDLAPSSSGGSPDAQPIAGPKDDPPLQITSSRENQKLLTYDEPRLLTHQPSADPGSGPNEQPMAAASAPATSSLQGPDESVPAAAPADSGPPKDQSMSM